MDLHRNTLVKFAGSNGPIRKSDVGVMIKYEGVPVAWICGSYRDSPDPGAFLYHRPCQQLKTCLLGSGCRDANQKKNSGISKHNIGSYHHNSNRTQRPPAAPVRQSVMWLATLLNQLHSRAPDLNCSQAYNRSLFIEI